MSAFPAALVQTLAPLALSLRVTVSTRSTLTSAFLAVLAQMLAPLALSLRSNKYILNRDGGEGNFAFFFVRRKCFMSISV